MTQFQNFCCILKITKKTRFQDIEFYRCVKLAPQSEVQTKIFTYSERASFAPPKNPTSHPAPLSNGRYRQKSKQQYWAQSIALYLQFSFQKKIHSSPFKTVFRGHFLCTGGSLLRKRGANDNIGLNR